MATPKSPKQPKKAVSKPASGEKPKKKNNVGKVVEKSTPAPQKPNVRPDVKNTHEYLDSVKKEDIPSEGKRLSQELKTASDNKDYVRATQLKDAMAGLKDKGVQSGLKAADLASLDDGTALRISEAFENMGGNTARLGKGLSAAKSMTQPKPGDKPTPATAAKPAPAPTPATTATPPGGNVPGRKVQKSNPDPCKHKNDAKKKKYIVYEADEFDKTGKKIGTYVGRTSGNANESTEAILNRRFNNHHRKNLGSPVAAFVTDRYAAVRGAEQILIDKNSTVKQINGVSPKNKKRHDYKACAELKM